MTLGPHHVASSLAAAAPAFDPKEKGLIFLHNPDDDNHFPVSIGVCGGFICKGQACNLPKGACDKKHMFRPTPSNMTLIEKNGDDLLAT